MEGQVKARPLAWQRFSAIILTLIGAPTVAVFAQEKTAEVRRDGPEISLRKSVQTRQYQGREVEGEDRIVARGDSLWRILVEEKGLSGKQFRSYIVIIRNLNPQVKNLDLLRVGDKIFIPLRPGQLLEERPLGDVSGAEPFRPGGGATIKYRVKRGEHLYQILRDRLKLTEDRKVAQYYALVRDLNPERHNWDTLLEGEVIRLPVVGPSDGTGAVLDAPVASPQLGAETTVVAESQSAITPKAEAEGSVVGEAKAPAEPRAAVILQWREVLKSPANENLALLGKVAEAIGSQMEQSGEEVVPLKDGAVRFDKGDYPVVTNPSLKQRVVLDPNDRIPPSLRSKLGDPSIGAPILPMANGVSVHDAVAQLLTGLGYQTLPAGRPVVIQEEGVTYEAQGHWMALAPENNNEMQQIYVISLSENGVEIPQYLKSQLAKKGLHLKHVLLSPMTVGSQVEPNRDSKDFFTPIRTWPGNKNEIVDSLLFAFGVPFGVAETLSVELQSGFRIDARTDRVFELRGKRTALFFNRYDQEILKALENKDNLRAVELEIGSLSSREIISRLLELLGNPAPYREHRFAAVNGSATNQLTVTAWGFHVPQRSMFITDRRIPAPLHRFFFEKGLEIVYFQ